MEISLLDCESALGRSRHHIDRSSSFPITTMISPIEKHDLPYYRELLRDTVHREEERRIPLAGINSMPANGHDKTSSLADFGKRFLTFREKVDNEIIMIYYNFERLSVPNYL